MKKVKYYTHEMYVFADLLRRYVCFHSGEDMYNIELWGLSNYGIMNKLRVKGYVISDYCKENKTCWYKPSKQIIDEVIKPAYFLFQFDTDKHGHDIYTIDYLKYIQEAIKQ